MPFCSTSLPLNRMRDGPVVSRPVSPGRKLVGSTALVDVMESLGGQLQDDRLQMIDVVVAVRYDPFGMRHALRQAVVVHRSMNVVRPRLHRERDADQARCDQSNY